MTVALKDDAAYHEMIDMLRLDGDHLRPNDGWYYTAAAEIYGEEPLDEDLLASNIIEHPPFYDMVCVALYYGRTRTLGSEYNLATKSNIYGYEWRVDVLTNSAAGFLCVHKRLAVDHRGKCVMRSAVAERVEINGQAYYRYEMKVFVVTEHSPMTLMARWEW